MAPAVTNRAALGRHGDRALRSAALDVIDAGLTAADPYPAVLEQVRLRGQVLETAGRAYDLASTGRVVFVGAGKASLRIAEALEQLLGDRLTGGLVVVRRGEGRSLRRIEVAEADHPVPGPDSAAAAERLLALADMAGPTDLVVAAFTGGSSALASLPPKGMAFRHKRQLHQLLLASGARIDDVNAVRKHVSAIKGGRLARAAAPARVLNLTVSDVVGDRLDCITDLTVSDGSTVGDAIAVLERRGLWEQVDESVREHLCCAPEAQAPDLADLDIATVLVVCGHSVATAMQAHAQAAGFRAVRLGSSIEGDAVTVGAVLASLASESSRSGEPFITPCMLVGAGGETTVRLGDPDADPGHGGPNQETALAFARGLQEGVRAAGAFIDSDGSDGGTAFAGGVADCTSLERARSCGTDLDAALADHRSSRALAELGDLIETGPTFTNVSDLLAIAIDTGAAG